jgi:hypothetical protein
VRLDAGKTMGSSACSIVSSGGEQRRLGLLRAVVTFGCRRRACSAAILTKGKT